MRHGSGSQGIGDVVAPRHGSSTTTIARRRVQRETAARSGCFDLGGMNSASSIEAETQYARLPARLAK